MRDNRWVVKNHKHLEKRESELRRLMAQHKRLGQQIEKRRNDLALLRQVDEIFEGVAIYDWGHGTNHHFSTVVGDFHADVWPNAHNGGKTYGVTLMDLSNPGHYGSGPRRSGGLMLGNQYTYDEAVLRAKRFVAHGSWQDDDN
jgi:hypothetical protein